MALEMPSIAFSQQLPSRALRLKLPSLALPLELPSLPLVYGQQSMLRFLCPNGKQRQKTAHATASPSVVSSATAVATSAWNYLTGSRAVGERPSANQHQTAPNSQLQPTSNRTAPSSKPPSSAKRNRTWRAHESDEVEEHEEEEAAAALVGMQNQSAEDAACTPSSKLPSSQTSPKSSMRRSGRNQSAEDAACTPSSKLPSPQTSPTSGGWRAGRSLNGSVQVEPPFTLHSRGSSRRASKFVSHGGITKIVPTDRPISTQAEKCTRNGKTDFRALRDAFNQRFAQLFQPGAPDVPDDKMLYSKSVTHLRSYFNTQHHAFRANDSHRFNRGVAAMPGAAKRGIVPETEPAQLATECVDLRLELGASQPDLASTAAKPALEIGAAQHSLESRAPQLGHGIGDAQHSLQSTAAQQGLEIEAAQLGPAIGAAQPTIVYGQQSMLRFCAPMASKRQKTAHATASPSVVFSATAVATSAWNYLTGSRAVGERPSANQHQTAPNSQLQPTSNRQLPAPSPQLQPSSNRQLLAPSPHLQPSSIRQFPAPSPKLQQTSNSTTPVTKKSYMCNSCALLGHKLLLKAEHPKTGCPYKGQDAEEAKVNTMKSVSWPVGTKWDLKQYLRMISRDKAHQKEWNQLEMTDAAKQLLKM
eukprot:gene7120-225_t